MPAVSLTGSDTVQINGTMITTLADGAPVDITFPNNLATVKAGKDGNTIYAKNEMGRMCDVSMRVLLGGADDKFMNSLLQQWIQNPSGFTFLTAMFVKRVGDGAGNLQSKVYQCSGGTFVKQPEVKTSSEGDVEQSVVVYSMTFGNCQISIQ